MLVEALERLALQWVPEHNCLFADGHGPGRGMLKKALMLLCQQIPWILQDQAAAVWTTWQKTNAELNPGGIKAIDNVLFDVMKNCFAVPSINDSINAILKGGVTP